MTTVRDEARAALDAYDDETQDFIVTSDRVADALRALLNEPVSDAQVRVVAITLFQDYDSEHDGAKVDDFMGLARHALEAARDAS